MVTYDVALSYAREQESYVSRVAAYLRLHGISIYEDRLERARSIGRNLEEELAAIYGQESLCVVLFLSEDYRRKRWTMHEFRSVVAVAAEQGSGFVIPVRFDDAEMEGLSRGLVYLQADRTEPDELGKLILRKLGERAPLGGALTFGVDLWRITRARYAAHAYSGVNPMRERGGRWHQPGTTLVYAASTLCAAILEMAPWIGAGAAVSDFIAVGARLTSRAPVREAHPRNLPPGWRTAPTHEQLQEMGTKWAEEGAEFALAIPSRVLPAERLYLLNPSHPDFGRITLTAEIPVDLRLLQRS